MWQIQNELGKLIQVARQNKIQQLYHIPVNIDINKTCHNHNLSINKFSKTIEYTTHAPGHYHTIE